MSSRGIRSPQELGKAFARNLLQMGLVERLESPVIEEDRRQAPRNEEDTLP